MPPQCRCDINNETVAVVVSTPEEDYDSMNIDELWGIFRSKGLDTTDVKNMIVARLKAISIETVVTTSTTVAASSIPKRTRRTIDDCDDVEMMVDVRKEKINSFDALRNIEFGFNKCWPKKLEQISALNDSVQVAVVLPQTTLHKIVKCINKTLGEFVFKIDYNKFTCRQITTRGSAVGKVSCVFGMCESTTTPGCITVSDYDNNRIQEFSLNGPNTPRVVAQFEQGSSPHGIAPCIDGSQDYIVSLFSSHQVTRISGVDGSVKWTVGTRGNGIGKFKYPCGVLVLPNGQTVIADSYNDRLQILDTLTGRFIKQINLPGKRPKGLAYDANSGLVFVSQYCSHNIVAIDMKTGTVVRTIGNGCGSGLGQLNSPRGIAFDYYGNLLVANCCNNRIVVFNASGGTPITTFPISQWPFSIYVDKKSDSVVGGGGHFLSIYQ